MIEPATRRVVSVTETGAGAAAVLDDAVLGDLTKIGPISVRVRARWRRVDDALATLEHDPVLYRWQLDSTGLPALFVEVPLRDALDGDELLRFRDAVNAAINEIHGDASVYVHFVGPQPLDEAADAE